jgi:glycosyltransferase involved in cell wall biosynthesis
MAEPGRILFVTEKFPHPIDDGGQIRTYHVLRCLSARLPVTLVSLDAPSAADEEAIRALSVEVVCCGPRRRPWTAPFFAAQALFTRAPYPMRKNFSRALLGEIRKRIAGGGIGTVHFNHLDAAQYVEHLGPERTQVRAVFDTHNLLTRMYERFARTASNPLRKSYATVQWWKMARFEPALLRAVDRVLVCSDLERELVHTWGVDGAMIVPNGVDLTRFARIERRPRATSEPPVIVFTGALSYLPNAEGVRWFVESVVPELRKVLPRFRLVVVGKGAPRSLIAHAKPGEIEFTGWVADVRPWLAQADVCVVPLRIGGGTRIKILEAMAAGVPVVSTRVGAEGIAAREGESILLADEPRAMAQAVAQLCSSAEKARALSERGRALVVAHYGWDTVTASLVDFHAGAGRA